MSLVILRVVITMGGNGDAKVESNHAKRKTEGTIRPPVNGKRLTVANDSKTKGKECAFH